MQNLCAIMQGAGCLKQYHICIPRVKYRDFWNQCSVNMHSSMQKASGFLIIPDDKVLHDKTTYYLQNKKYLLLEIY